MDDGGQFQRRPSEKTIDFMLPARANVINGAIRVTE
jgi:hypothetical protein